MTADTGAARRVAVLIDADNVPAGVLDDVMREARSHGSVVVACAYRHWTEKDRKGWKAGCAKHAVQMVEQAPGPNATDIALAMDAVDLLLGRHLDVVCVVSGDRDFAPLAARLHRSRLVAVLMGDPAKVKDSNRALWDAFVPLTVTRKAASKTVAKADPSARAKPSGAAPANTASAKPVAAAATAATAQAARPTTRPSELVQHVLARLADGTVKKDPGGWVILNEIGKGIPENLKRPSLLKALEAAGSDAIEVQPRSSSGKANPTHWIRRRASTG
jgi:hypothetical protein